MSTARFNTLQNAAATKSVPVDTVIDGSAKAWVNYKGMATVGIRASFNVSSVTYNSTGDYTINFSTAMADANYATLVSAGRNGVNSDMAPMIKSGGTYTASAVQVQTLANSNYAAVIDADPLCVAIYR